jgi:hypothetical protein
LLQELPDRPVRVFAVWEPVLPTDIGPPTANVVSRLSDARVEQYWDPGRLLSGRILTASHTVPAFAIFSGELSAAWDLAAVYPPGSRWEGGVPAPVYCGNPVAESIDSLRVRLVSASASGS